ncbi:MAG: hypothetical protein KDM91_23200, partial [Verrucomicrobiae bacterium]|nr:hypothetical protein [Verrucomicrobiae bacterium]
MPPVAERKLAPLQKPAPAEKAASPEAPDAPPPPLDSIPVWKAPETALEPEAAPPAIPDRFEALDPSPATEAAEPKSEGPGESAFGKEDHEDDPDETAETNPSRWGSLDLPKFRPSEQPAKPIRLLWKEDDEEDEEDRFSKETEPVGMALEAAPEAEAANPDPMPESDEEAVALAETKPTLEEVRPFALGDLAKVEAGKPDADVALDDFESLATDENDGEAVVTEPVSPPEPASDARPPKSIAITIPEEAPRPRAVEAGPAEAPKPDDTTSVPVFPTSRLSAGAGVPRNSRFPSASPMAKHNASGGGLSLSGTAVTAPLGDPTLPVSLRPPETVETDFSPPVRPFTFGAGPVAEPSKGDPAPEAAKSAPTEAAKTPPVEISSEPAAAVPAGPSFAGAVGPLFDLELGIPTPAPAQAVENPAANPVPDPPQAIIERPRFQPKAEASKPAPPFEEERPFPKADAVAPPTDSPKPEAIDSPP